MAQNHDSRAMLNIWTPIYCKKNCEEHSGGQEEIRALVCRPCRSMWSGFVLHNFKIYFLGDDALRYSSL